MEPFFRKSLKEFYSFIFLLLLSISTIVLDYKYNQINYLRSTINDLIIYPLNYISTVPKRILEISLKDSEEKSVLESQIKELTNQNIKLKIQLQEYQSLKDENARLRSMSKKSLSISKKQALVKVINNNAHPTKKVSTIDKGRKEGIFIGQNVIGLKGLVGQVIEVNYLSSNVLLISDLNHNIPAQITRTGEKILVKGMNYNNKLEVIFAELNMDVRVGDSITTSGMAKRFKENIPIGKVSLVENDQDANFTKINIVPFENIGNSSELILIWDYIPQDQNE